MKVLYAASEAYPFAMSGGLADVAGALPKALRRRLIGCRVVLPLYSSMTSTLCLFPERTAVITLRPAILNCRS